MAMTPFDRFASGHAAHDAWSLAAASALAYPPSDPVRTWRGEVDRAARAWRFSRAECLDARGTQAVVLSRPGCVVVAFRGTELMEPEREPQPRRWWNLWGRLDWRRFVDVFTDAKVRKVALPCYPGRVHRGFAAALDAVWPALRSELIERALKTVKAGFGLRVYLTGHSLGGALATLAAARLLEDDDARDIGLRPYALVTFGAPRVGSPAFARALAEKLPRIQRFRNHNDLVPRLPAAWWNYRHAGAECYLSRRGELWRDPHGCAVLFDRVWGRVAQRAAMLLTGRWQWATDGLGDHAIAEYVRLTGALAEREGAA